MQTGPPWGSLVSDWCFRHHQETWFHGYQHLVRKERPHPSNASQPCELQTTSTSRKNIRRKKRGSVCPSLLAWIEFDLRTSCNQFRTSPMVFPLETVAKTNQHLTSSHLFNRYLLAVTVTNRSTWHVDMLIFPIFIFDKISTGITSSCQCKYKSDTGKIMQYFYHTPFYIPFFYFALQPILH